MTADTGYDLLKYLIIQFRHNGSSRIRMIATVYVEPQDYNHSFD